MAVELINYFDVTPNSILERYDRDISSLLPEAAPVSPAYSDYGAVSEIYYSSADSNIRIESAWNVSYTRDQMEDGESAVLLAIPFTGGSVSVTPICYYGVRVNRNGATISVRCGFFTDATLTTPFGVDTTRGVSTSGNATYRVGVGLIRLDWRDSDPQTYIHGSDKYVLATWYGDYSMWTADYAQLKTTTLVANKGYLLEGNMGPNTGLIMYDLYEVRRLNSGLLYPRDSFHDAGFSPEVGPESEPGGMNQGDDVPTFDDSSDTIELPEVPELGVSNVGFVRVYKTGINSLQNIGVELFPPLSYTPPTPITATDEVDAIVNGFNSIVTFLANIPSFFDQMVASTLINYVIDCHVIPVTPSSGSSEPIKVGWKTLQASAARLSSDYVDFSCGSISIGEYYANFADFITTAKLYLPFVGFVPVRAEWFQRDTLKVNYRFNVIDGSFVCYVRSGGKYVNNGDTSGTIVGQYGGNACIHLPITGVT